MQSEVDRGRGRYCSTACRLACRWPDVETRFRNSYTVHPETGCWIWTASIGTDGYASFWNGTRNIHASRYSWALVNGPIPDGLDIMHDCPGGDNPLCVCPDHLRPGTRKENLQDSIDKGRSPKHRPRMTVADAEAIRQRYAVGGVTMQQLAAEAKVTIPTIWNIIRQRTFKPGSRLHGLYRGRSHRPKGKPGYCRGEQSHLATITEDQARQILAIYQGGDATITEIAGLVNTTREVVYNIVMGKTWKHLQQPPPDTPG
jgi:hypothetical protein